MSAPARVGVLGAGVMGTAVARLAARLGHPVILGSRRDAPDRVPGVEHGSWPEAAGGADLLFVATLWEDVEEVARTVRGSGARPRVVVDCTNPEGPDGPGLVVGTSTSGAELLAERLGGGTAVVKALNHVYAELLDRMPVVEGPRPAGFHCGDDPEARRRVRDFLEAAGFAPVDVGPLRAARFLEPTAQLVVALVRERGMEPGTTALTLTEAPPTRASSRADRKERP